MAAADTRDIIPAMSSIVSHAWNAAQTEIVVATISPTATIYAVTPETRHEPSRWTVAGLLAKHTHNVLDVDWNTQRDIICTAGEDCTVYVWTRSAGGWVPQISALAPFCTRSILRCAIRPGAGVMRVCVASADGWCPVLRFNPTHQAWLPVVMKGVPPVQHASAVTAVAWNPVRTALVATGGMDGCVVVTSAAKLWKGEDADDELSAPPPLGTEVGRWGTPAEGGAWIRSVAWAPDGSALAWATQGCVVCVADMSTPEAVAAAATGGSVQKMALGFLPFAALAFLAPDMFVGAGHDCYAVAFKRSKSGVWAPAGKFLQRAGAPVSAATSAMADVRAKVQTEAALGTAAVEARASRHQLAISSVRVLTHGADFAFSTAGRDGAVCVWGPKDMAPL